MIPTDWLIQAYERIQPHIQRTPLTYDRDLDIYLKWENRQVTGSFKARGALNKVLVLEPWERERGLVAASAGNHGQGVALAGKMIGASVKIFVSESAVPTKVKAMRALNAEVVRIRGGYGEAEQAGLQYAQETGATWVSPYNDGQVIAGQGTIGLEALNQLPAGVAATWIVPTSGGGLISGIGAAIKQLPSFSPEISVQKQLIGVQSEASAFMHALFYSGSQVGIQELPSLADGLAGTVEEGSITISLTKKFVDDILLISESEIKRAIAYAWEQYQEMIEGSAAVALAAVISGKIAHRPAVAIISGGNIQPELHAEIVA